MADDPRLTHLDEQGRLRMVDVSGKTPTDRRAVASAVVRLGEAAFRQLSTGKVAKGDALAAARVAGIMAAKRTGDLIPLCHGLSPEFVDVRIELTPPATARIVAEARVQARTGVEMEAMVAASVAALTLYDMCKSISKGITIGPVQLEHKSGGKSGEWRREPEPG